MNTCSLDVVQPNPQIFPLYKPCKPHNTDTFRAVPSLKKVKTGSSN